jgi:branched-chain amino acid transport system permease protein
VNLVINAVVNGSILGAAYGVAGVVFALIYRIVKVFHFAFAAIGTSGAYLAAVLVGASSDWVRLVFGVICGMALSGALTTSCYIAVYRPMSRRGATSGTTFVSSLALGLIIEAVLVILVGPGNRIYPLGTFEVQKSVLGMQVSGLNILAICVLIVTTALCSTFMKATPAGRQTEAVISNIDHAELVGIRSGLLTALLCAGLGALSVPAFVVQGMNSSLSISDGVPLALFGVLAMLCAGIANIWGTALAGLLIGIVAALSATVVPGQWSSTIVYGFAMIVVLIRPDGATVKAGSS